VICDTRIIIDCYSFGVGIRTFLLFRVLLDPPIAVTLAAKNRGSSHDAGSESIRTKQLGPK
jgi:hypothetical protein